MNQPDSIRVAVVSPFLDKQHGTERCVSEQVERLARDYEIHLYSTRVEGVNLQGIVWHRVPALPGPHLFAYVWWFAANHVQRWWDATFRGLKCRLIYSPGVNCLDADVISVHIIFSEFRRQMRDGLRFRRNTLTAWPRLAHRRTYYRLLCMLERWNYLRQGVSLLPVSRKVAHDLERHFGRNANISLLYHGWDPLRFGLERRRKQRTEARNQLGLSASDFVLLLIGNDWKSKGLPCLVDAARRLRPSDFRILVAGSDNRSSYVGMTGQAGLQDCVRFLPLREDVEFYYAAADAYVGPSLEDAFAMPALEAMACGLPVIVSRQAGVSEIITQNVDGLVLEDSRDSAALAAMIENLRRDPAFARSLGEKAAQTAKQFTWERNVKQLREVIDEVVRSRQGQVRCPESVAY